MLICLSIYMFLISFIFVSDFINKIQLIDKIQLKEKINFNIESLICLLVFVLFLSISFFILYFAYQIIK